MATEYTENYELDLYVGEDKPNLRDQYNAAMGKVDAALQGLHEGHADNVEAIASANASIAANATEIGKLQATDATHTSQITALQNGQTSLNTRMGTAEGDIDALQASTGSIRNDVNSLSGEVNALPNWETVKTGTINFGSKTVADSLVFPTGQSKSVTYTVRKLGNLYHLNIGGGVPFRMKHFTMAGTIWVPLPELEQFFPTTEYHAFVSWGDMLTVQSGDNFHYIPCGLVFRNNRSPYDNGSSTYDNHFGVSVPANSGQYNFVNADYLWYKA